MPGCVRTMRRRWLACTAVRTVWVTKARHHRRQCRRVLARRRQRPDTDFLVRTRPTFRTRIISSPHRKTTRHRSHAPGSRTARSRARQDILMTQLSQTGKRTTRKAQAAPHIPPVVADTSKPAAETEVAARTPRPVLPIPQSAMQDAAFARNWWRVVIDAERTPFDSVLADVAVWGPNEAKLRAGDLVEVLDEQSTLFALLYLVEHVPGKFIRFAELIKAPLGGLAIGRIEARGNHYAQWRGPARRWCVIGPTGTVVRDGILSKEEADRDVTTRNMPTNMAFVSHPRM